MKGTQILIPAQLLPEMLKRIHEGYMGVVKRRRAHENPKTITATMQTLGGIGNRYNGAQTEAVPIYYFRFLEVVTLDKTTSRAVIVRMKNIFARHRHGIPQMEFFKEYGFSHRTSSPRFPQSNGEAEKVVDIAKCSLSKLEDPNLGLLSYRCTYTFGVRWKLRNTLPMITPLLRPIWDNEAAVQGFRLKDLALNKRNRRIYDRKSRVKDLPILKARDKVWNTNMSCYGRVQAVAEAPRSYMVVTEKGLLCRDRKQLIKLIKGGLSKYQVLANKTNKMNNKRDITKQAVLRTTFAQQERGEHQALLKRCYF
ncbi:hypothetical protein PR048_021624 [Dryococelus australis]|uniref:Integrase catalytic domain-containing protein n=1 Tax=Dryococelus australis TaxID=614101 RepID=A0ABQ9GYQ2_9NEOP|nr:hypothetical protein PR048_021624 [Dryococelus australis]